jgi:hypothetical protein
MVWEFDIGVSNHDYLAQGITVVEYRRVTVLADTFLQARLIASQLAASDGMMPTEALLCV